MIINTNQPRANVCMTRHEREERAAAAARKRHLNDLRDRVRASMVGMDETPADPSLVAHAGLQADALWKKVETNPRTGHCQKVKGREDCTSAPTTALKGLPVQPRTRDDDRTVASVLRAIADVEKVGKRLMVIYHDGEREVLVEAMPFLVEIISNELNREVSASEVTTAATSLAITGRRLPVTGC